MNDNGNGKKLNRRKARQLNKAQQMDVTLKMANLQAATATEQYQKCRELQHAILQTLKFDMEVFSSGKVKY